MPRRPLLIVVLAAGQGTRMKSAVPKVLHAVGGRSMLGHVLSTALELQPQSLAVVIGPGMEQVRAEILAQAPRASVWVQAEPKGTADAALAAHKALAAHSGDVLVVYGDTPLLTAATLNRLVQALDDGADVAVLGFEPADPSGYGRLKTDKEGGLVAIREEKDASLEERAIRLCNSGVMAFRRDDLLNLLASIGNDNAKGEYYLTDAVAIIRTSGGRAGLVTCSEDEVLGVNSRDQLAAAEAIFQARVRLRAMQEGATLIAPETVWLSFDTKIGRDVIIEPNVFLGPGVTIENGAEIKANCYIEHSHIGEGARVGPFARLRPGVDVGRGARVGNFVELKNAKLGAGAKANHLAYIGDAEVGAKSNIGAGTIFCNYDGFNKYRTELGEGVFVGSNSSLVAPLKIGAGAYIGSGSVITKDVPADALALERTEQVVRPGWAAKFRAVLGRRKVKTD